jgi:hypothetical protein
MYINRTDSSNINAMPQGGLPDKQARATTAGEGILSVSTDTDGYAEKALSLSPRSAPTAIEEAKALIASGRLDTLDAIRQAAANIAARGI